MSDSPQKIRILGAGVVGLTAAYEFAVAGHRSRSSSATQGQGSAVPISPAACRALVRGESAPPLVVEWGSKASLLERDVRLAKVHGSLLVAPARDRADLVRFSRRTPSFEWLDAARSLRCEPHLAGRFDRALFFPGEAHLDPRAAMAALAARLPISECEFRFNTSAEDVTGRRLDDRLPRVCRARCIADLRGVKGEMLVVKTDEISFQRPVQLLHPRHPVYVVPRGDGRFMVGATAVENEESPRITARSMLELLSAVYALHPAFGEAEIVETGADLRPTFPDNLPRLRREGRTIYINGLYRHGYLWRRRWRGAPWRLRLRTKFFRR